MPASRLYHRIKTYPSGRRVKYAFRGDRLVSTTTLPRTKKTKTRRRLDRRRRRLRRLGI